MADINNPFQTDEVVGIAPAPRRNDIVDVLRTNGFDVEVLDGPHDADQIDLDGDGLAGKIIRFFQQGEELDSLREFKAQLEDGNSVVRVLSVGDRAEEAGRIIVDGGGETIWHYGSWTYRKLHD
ncbi:MAG: hypothetical protein R2733_23740 [Acidimicrobiales bacterium]